MLLRCFCLCFKCLKYLSQNKNKIKNCPNNLNIYTTDVSLINSGFNNFGFSSDANIIPDENLKSFFTKCNSIETPFNDPDHPVSRFQIP